MKKESRIRNIGLKGEMEQFIEDLAILLSANMDIASGLEVLASEAKNPRMKKIIDNILEDINDDVMIQRVRGQVIELCRRFPVYT